MSFNFRYAPWPDVLKLFAETAGLTMDLNDTPTGTFNYLDDHPYTVTEALDVLNGYLLPKGYVLVRRDRFLVCLNLDDGIPPNLVPVISAAELPHRGKNELVSIVIPLDGLKPSDVAGEVQQLLGPQGKVASLNNTNSLFVMDTGANVRRVHELLVASSAMSRGDTAFKSIPLKHISASDAERMIRRLFGLNPQTSITSTAGATSPQFPGFGGPFGGFGGFGPPGFGGFDRSRDERGGDRGGDPRSSSRGGSAPATTAATRSPYADKIWVTADSRTNHLLVTASPDLLRVVENAVTSLDTGTDADGRPIVDSDNPLTMKVYPVTGNATQVGTTLSLMIPGLGITDDAASGRLYVQATADEHAEVAKLLQEIDGSGSNSVAVIPLQRLDPVAATNTLRNLFINEGSRAPSIEADAAGRRLLVKGSPDQVSQVRALLADLGESGDNRKSDSDRGNLRVFSLQGRDPNEFLPMLRQMWSSSEPNPIRIVVPSQTSPIRDLKVPSNSDLPGGRRPADLTEPQTRHDAPQIMGARLQGVSLQNADLQAPVKPADEGPAERSTPQTFDDFLKGLSEPAPAEGAAAQPGAEAPVGITVVGDELMLGSSDTAALDQMEAMLEQLAAMMPVKTQWTVFYLRSADATETAQMLERLFPQSSVTTSTQQSDGILGSLSGGLSSLGRGMMNVTGLNSTLGGQALRIVTDIRSNALFISGPTSTVAEVEQMLQLLDATELPTSLRTRVPRTIAVEYADVEDVASIVESVFKDEMTAQEPAANRQSQGRGGSGFNPLAMMMGATQNQGRPAEVQLTLGIDRQTSHLIVSCSDSLFRQVEDLVLEMDGRARDAKPVVRVVPLASADPAIISTTLSSLIPKVSVSATRSQRRQSSQPENSTPGGGGAPAATPPSGADAFRQMMEDRMRQRSSGGDSSRGGFGGGNGGGFPGGGFPGGGFGGNRGGDSGFNRGSRGGSR